jgi:repressor LexA
MFLTRRQQEILEFVREFTRKWGYAPSLEEIQHRFKLSSAATVHKHLHNLEAKGFLRREPHRSRALELVDAAPASPEGCANVPLLGLVAAGQPIQAIAQDEQETVTIPEQMLGRGRTYVLKVRGDSMIDDCIQDGDFVIVEERFAARNGEMVIACLNGDEVTLKRYFRDSRGVRLQPANARYEPIIIDEEAVRIQGVVIGVLRRY